VREAVWPSGQAPFEHVEGMLQRLRGLSISDSSIWRMVQGCGERFRALEGRQRQEAMVRLRAEGWWRLPGGQAGGQGGEDWGAGGSGGGGADELRGASGWAGGLWRAHVG
jgi:hypothetical protein